MNIIINIYIHSPKCSTVFNSTVTCIPRITLNTAISKKIISNKTLVLLFPREFCDSIEQGTVWDNTYEESDSSHMARSHQDENNPQLAHPPAPRNLPDDNDSPIFELSSNHSKNNRPPVLELNFVGPYMTDQNPQFLEKENIPIDPLADLNDTEDDIMFPENPQINPKEPHQRFEIYCDEDNSPSETPKEQRLCANESDRTLTLTDSKCLALTCEETGMEMTSAVPSVITSTKNTRRSEFDGMEMTEVIPSVLTSTKIGSRSDFDGMEMTSAIPSVLTSTKITRTSDFDGMEMTSVIPSFLTSTKINRRSAFDGMEMTEALSSVLSTLEKDKTGKEMPESGLQPITKSAFNGEGSQILHHHGMDMTEPISIVRPQKPPRKSLSNYDRMEMTEPISRLPLHAEVDFDESHSQSKDERTQFYQHGMEMTEPISSLPRPQKPARKSLNPEGMDMTEAISSILTSKKPSRKSVLSSEGMDRTEAISSVLTSKKPARKSVLSSEGMDMTEAISSVLTFKKPARKSVLSSGGMEMTEAIHGILPSSDPDEKTQFFYGGVDITEAIAPSFPLGAPLEEIEPSEITHNYFMELTQAIPSLKRPYSNILREDAIDSNLASPRSKSPKDDAIFTPVVPSQQDREALHRLLHSGGDSVESSPPDLQNQSMEFTSAITAHLKPQNPDNFLEISCRQQVESEDINTEEAGQALPSSESSSSWKENVTPERNVTPTPVSRPLFQEQDNEVIASPTPLNNCEERESIRYRSAADGRNFEDITIEITTVIPKLQEDSGTLSSSDIQNVEAPSFIFADSLSEENSLPQSGNESTIEELSNLGVEARRHAEAKREIIPQNYEATQVRSQEITCDMRPVDIPEVELTEEITMAEDRRRTRVLQRHETDDMKKRRTYNIPEDRSVRGDERSLEHDLMRHEADDMKKRRTYTIPEDRSVRGDQSSLEDDRRRHEADNMKNRRTYNIPEDKSIRGDESSLEDDHRRIRTIRRHEEEEIEVIQRKKKLTVSMDVDGGIQVETIKEATVMRFESKMADVETVSNDRIKDKENQQAKEQERSQDTVLEKSNRVRSDNSAVNLRDEEADSLKLNPQNDNLDKERNDSVPLEELSQRERLLKENDSIVKKISKLRKQEEIIRQKKQKSHETSLELATKLDDSQIKDIEQELTAFESMKRSLEEFSAARGCFWKPFRILEDKVSVEFKKTGFLFGVSFHVPDGDDDIERIKEFHAIGRLNSGEKAILKMTDRLIIDRINRSTSEFKLQFRHYDHVLPLIKAVTEEVRFIYDFYEELKKMSYRNVMEIQLDWLSFVVITNSSDTILKVIMNIKAFDEIGPEDIQVQCFLGNVKCVLIIMVV